jgi:hypothetical protein
MSDVPLDLDQIEFRWTPDDLAVVASSAGGEATERWRRRLRTWAVSPVEEGVRRVRSSAVYLPYDDGDAALILRSIDALAQQIYPGVTPDRSRIVARALVGPAETLTPCRALELAASRMSLDPEPGQVQPGTNMTPLRMASPQVFLGYPPPNPSPRGLAALVAAVLRSPDEPVTFLLDAQVPLDLTGSPALPLLWLTHQLVTPLISGAEDRECRRWLRAFSTFETGLRQSDGPIGVTFRIEQPRELGDAPPPISAGSSPRPDLEGETALNLVALYDRMGINAVKHLRDLVAGRPSLRSRLEAVYHGRDPQSMAEHRPPPSTSRQRPHQVASPVRAEGEIPTAPEVPKPRTRTDFPFRELYQDLSRHLTWDRERHLAKQEGRAPVRPADKPVRNFRTVIDWFTYASRQRCRLPYEQQRMNVLDELTQSSGARLWPMLEDCYGPRASERMADVLYPVFASAAENLDDLRALYAQMPRVASAGNAIPVLCGLLGPEAGEELERCAFPPLPEQIAKPDAFADNPSGVTGDQDGVLTRFAAWLERRGEWLDPRLGGLLLVIVLGEFLALVIWLIVAVIMHRT